MKIDPNILDTVVGSVDEDGEAVGSPATADQVVKALLGEDTNIAPLRELAIDRTFRALGVTGVKDLEERQDEVSRSIRMFMDGFIIATRYAQEDRT